MTDPARSEAAEQDSDGAGAAVLRNRPFLLLWLSQVATQLGGNMVLYALTVVVLDASAMIGAVSGLFLAFLVPSVLLSALAGVYVDRFDRRTILVATNALRAVVLVGIFAVGNDFGMILLLVTVFSIITVFFAPAESAMIPVLVKREQLVAANGLFTLTLNAAFPLGYALLGSLVVTIAGGPQPLIIIVAVMFGLAAISCLTLPSDPPVKRSGPGHLDAVTEAGQAIGGVFGQLREGIGYIRDNPAISWSMAYLGISASLIGVIAVLGPSFASDTLGLKSKDLIVVVFPLGIGIVMGVLLLNAYGKYIARRRAIELGLVLLGVLILNLTIANQVSRILTGVGDNLPLDVSALTSLVSVVVAIGFFAGVCYGIVAISAQVQLQEDIPADGRGRVFGVLNMLISVASILPIIIVGPLADRIGTTAVILSVAIFVLASGIISIVVRGPIRSGESPDLVPENMPGAQLDPTGTGLPMQGRGPDEQS